MPVLLSCNFIVDSTNGNGFGLRSLKGNGIQSVYMNVENGIAGTPPMGLSRSYGILASSAVINTGSSVLTGNLGLSPGTSVTGFPPGTFSGAENIANTAAASAKSQAQAAYTYLAGLTPTPITAVLDGQTLTPGVYSESSSTFSLAGSGNGTLILNGAGVYVFQAASTLVTGAGGTPTITLENGASAANVYWVVGSSATINSGNAGTFQGNIIAHTSITDTLGGTVNGSLIALNGAVTLSAASTINVQPLVAAFVAPGNPNPEPGVIMVQLQDNYNRYLGGFSGQVSPLSGLPLTSISAGTPYVIVSLGTTTQAQWTSAGVPKGVVPAVGVSFIAIASGSIGGSGAVEVPSASGVDNIEVIGDPDLSLAPVGAGQNNGGIILMQCLQDGVLQAPLDGSVISLSFYLSNSSVQVKGQ
jgi:hypothetical protein